MRVTDDSEGFARVRDAVHTVGIPKGVGGPHANLRATPSPLDSLNISVQKSKKYMVQLDGEKWHTRTFRLFAQKYLEFVFTYEGVDCWGNYRYCRNNLTPRWSEYRRRYTLARIYSWSEAVAPLAGLGLGYDLPVAHLVTLTVKHDTKGSYPSMVDTVNKLRRGWSGIRYWLSRSGVRYLRVMEPGEKNGYPHYHIVLVGADDAFCEELIRRWLKVCPDSLRKGQDYQRVESIKNVGAYVAKYLSKSFEREDSVQYWRWLELCYRLRLRCFSMDSASSAYIKTKYLKMPSGVGVCVLSDYDETIKTVDTIGSGNHIDNDDSENRGGVTAATPPPHRSRGARGVPLPHDESLPLFDRLINKAV